MERVSTTLFFTPFCARPPEPAAGARPRRGALAFLAALLLWLALAAAARGQERAGIDEMQIEHAPDGLLLTAALRLALPPIVEDALYKGISMHFVAEAEVLRERWYWYDKTVAHAARYLRLSYQPLTRRWRLAQSPAPFSTNGLNVPLGQNFDDLRDALAAMQRIAGWKIASEDVLDNSASYLVNFQFRLDTSQLPRPIQIGAVGHSDWSMLLERSMRVPARAPRAAPPPPVQPPQTAPEPAPVPEPRQ